MEENSLSTLHAGSLRRWQVALSRKAGTRFGFATRRPSRFSADNLAIQRFGTVSLLPFKRGETSRVCIELRRVHQQSTASDSRTALIQRVLLQPHLESLKERSKYDRRFHDTGWHKTLHHLETFLRQIDRGDK